MSLEVGEVDQPSIELKQALIDSTFRPGRVFEGPDAIDLNSLQADIEDLIDYTVAHPRNHEAGRIIYITSDRRVLVNKQPIQGSQGHVKMSSEIIFNNLLTHSRNIRQNRYIGSVIHSHPIDSPFSPSDLVGVLQSDQVIHGSTSVMLITPVRKLIVFRGQTTPHMSQEQADAYVSELDRAVLRRLRKFLRLGMPEAERQDISMRADRAMFRQMLKKNDLQVFEGGVWERVLYRVDAEEAAA